MLAFAHNGRNMHKAMAEVHVKLESLFNEIDASESRDLHEIKKALRLIAVEYRDLEDETRGFVKCTAHNANRVHNAATRVLKKTAKPEEAISSMDLNFQSLIAQLQDVKVRHASVCVSLKEEAAHAKEAKSRNDERAKMAEGLKDNAELSAVLAIPGVSLIGAPVALAMEFAEDDSDDDTVVKVLKGAAGAFVGLGLGIVLTAISPFLLGYSAVCGAQLAVLSRSWSTKFKDIEGQILHVHDIIDDSTRCLGDVMSGLRSLKSDISQWDPLLDSDTINAVFEDIANSSNELQDACKKYEQSLRSNNKRLKEITGTNKK